MKQASKQLATLAVAFLAPTLAAPTSAVDLDAGDYTALPGGTNALAIYGQHATRGAPYSKGDQVPINPRLDSDIDILRGVHFVDVDGHIIDPQLLLPSDRLSAKDDISALGSKSGVDDLILASAIWFTRPGDKTHFATIPYLWLSTRTYGRNQPPNLGEHRYKFASQTGYNTELASGINWDLVGDITLFGKNTDANDGQGGAITLEQKALYEFQTYLYYQLIPVLGLRVGLFHTFGGEAELGGMNQGDRQVTTKFNVGTAWFVAPTVQLLATYDRDIKVRNDFKINNQINLRLLTLF